MCCWNSIFCWFSICEKFNTTSMCSQVKLLYAIFFSLEKSVILFVRRDKITLCRCFNVALHLKGVMYVLGYKKQKSCHFLTFIRVASSRLGYIFSYIWSSQWDVNLGFQIINLLFCSLCGILPTISVDCCQGGLLLLLNFLMFMLCILLLSFWFYKRLMVKIWWVSIFVLCDVPMSKCKV